MRSVFCNKIVKETMNNKSGGCGEAAYQITVTRKEVQKPKRIRSAFTTNQINFLEEKYKKHPYIDKPNRKEVSRILNITERSVKIWFQNRRMREKHDNKEFDCNKRNSPNGRLTNSPLLINRTQLPLIMTDVSPNEKNNDKYDTSNTESMNNIKKESFKHIDEKTDKEKLRNIVKKELPKTKTTFKHSLFCKSGALNVPLQDSQSSQVHTKSPGNKQFQYSSIPKTVSSSTYFHPGYVSSTAIWRPVEIVPVVSKNLVPGLNTVKRSRQVSSACCKCNCHNTRTANMMKVQQKPIVPFPYPPLMFTAVPFQNPI